MNQPDGYLDRSLLALLGQISDGATARAVPVQAIGGVGVALRASRAPAMLRRHSADLDLVTSRSARTAIEHTFTAIGLVPEERFNAMHGTNRQIWWTADTDTHIDLFLGEFSMCHKLPLEGRLVVGEQALSPADLLLTKLQIVELNDKDVIDVGALLSVNRIVPTDEEDGINQSRVTDALCDDWGFLTTATDNLRKVTEVLCGRDLGKVADTIRSRAEELLVAVEAAPKSRRFRMRQRIGRRVRWYELPEESI